MSDASKLPRFAVTSDWAALGGSPAAASYFKLVDPTGLRLRPWAVNLLTFLVKGQIS
jgi:hypothetical protein